MISFETCERPVKAKAVAAGFLVAAITIVNPVLAETTFERTASELRNGALGSPLAWKLLESLTVEVGQRFAGTPGALAQNLAAHTTLAYYAAETETSFPPAPKRPERPRR